LQYVQNIIVGKIVEKPGMEAHVYNPGTQSYIGRSYLKKKKKSRKCVFIERKL
jgi:hypothetical protein